jgi:galactose mutarotase-like enzyme
MSKSFSNFELKTATSLLGISEHGGYVTNWQIKDSTGNWKPILYVGTELKRTGIPILFPYYGPSDSGMGQHGFGRNLPWKIISHSKTEAILELTDADLDAATTLLYPHNFQTQIKLTLSENSFEYTLDVKNTGTSPLPIAPGLHPYWSIEQNNKSQVTVENYPEIDSANIDWDHNPPDNEYNFKNPVTITFPNKKITIEDRSETISKLVLWSQPLVAPDHDFICFEPVTLPRNSFDENPLLIDPNKTFTIRLLFTAQTF